MLRQYINPDLIPTAAILEVTEKKYFSVMTANPMKMGVKLGPKQL
jgi:hypothetical protein